MTDWRSQMIDATAAIVSASDRPVGQSRILLRLVWRLLPMSDRQLFLAGLDEQLLYHAPKVRKSATPRDADLMEIIKYWQDVFQSVEGDQLAFAKSVAANIKKDDWWPSDKQANYMRAIWKDRFVVGGELEVTE